MDQQVHEMVLETTHASGAQEWYCPSCGRRFLMQWPPVYKKIVLDPGDEYAPHSGATGGLSVGPVEVSQSEGEPMSDESLRFWQRALEELDLDDLGDEEA